MWKTFRNCEPCIVNGTELATNEYEFVTTEVLKTKCDCIHKATCFEILRLLSEKKVDQAVDLLPKK